jgi:predicted RNA-binding Zn ribbon-like protein
MTAMSNRPIPAAAPAFFLADHKSLDFLNTLARPGGVATEWIGDGEAFLAWCRTAGMIDAADERTIRSTFSAGDLDQAAKEARSLREWFRSIVMSKGRLSSTTAQDATRRLNGVLREDERLQLLDAGESGGRAQLGWRAQRLWRQPKSLLAPIAESMGQLLLQEDLSLVRQCGGEDCTIIFLDRTKSHKRRWCSMAACGNRAKVAAFRARSAG